MTYEVIVCPRGTQGLEWVMHNIALSEVTTGVTLAIHPGDQAVFKSRRKHKAQEDCAVPHSEATDTKLSYWVLQSNRMGDVYFDDESVALCSDHLKKLRSLGGVSSGLNTCSVEISQELFSEIEKGKTTQAKFPGDSHYWDEQLRELIPGDIIEFHAHEGIIPLYRELVKVESYESYNVYFKLLPEQPLGHP